MAWTRALMVLLITGLAADGGQGPVGRVEATGTLPALTVRFIDYVGLSAGDFVDFRDQATAALRTAGIESVWAHCPATGNAARPAQCGGVPHDTEIILMMRPEGFVGQRKAMGSALPAEDGKGVYAWLYLQKIDRTAQICGVPIAGVMALAAVHEIGHLLAGRRHEIVGLMQAHWIERHIRSLLTRDGLRFNHWTAKRLRAGLAARANKTVAQTK